MPKFRYPLKPLEHMMATQYADASIPMSFSPITKNVKVHRHGVKKRWGYTSDRSLSAPIYNTICYQTAIGNRYTLYLTDADLAMRMTGTSETFQYLTDTWTDGAVTGISGATVTGNAWCQWQASSGLAAGDKFIMDLDGDAQIEPDANWATISSVDSDAQITLTAAYTGATTAGAYRTRKVYTVPANERWSFTTVDNNFIFTNGNTNVQYYNYLTAPTKAQTVNATYASRAKYCTAFADRLILADLYSGGLRNPSLVAYSANTNCLQFDNGTDATAGTFELLETEDYITGLGRVGPLLGVFKKYSITFYERSGDSTSPLRRYSISTGIGSSAPYSIVEALGTVLYLGKDDFYMINGDQPTPVGENMRYKFYDIVGETEADSTWGFSNPMENEIVWIASTSEGKYAFVWDYKYREWYIYQFTVDVTGAGMGAI